MGKSFRYNSESTIKSHKEFRKSKNHVKSGWKPKKVYSDRDINRRIQQGDFEDYD